MGMRFRIIKLSTYPWIDYFCQNEHRNDKEISHELDLRKRAEYWKRQTPLHTQAGRRDIEVCWKSLWNKSPVDIPNLYLECGGPFSLCEFKAFCSLRYALSLAEKSPFGRKLSCYLLVSFYKQAAIYYVYGEPRKSQARKIDLPTLSLSLSLSLSHFSFLFFLKSVYTLIKMKSSLQIILKSYTNFT